MFRGKTRRKVVYFINGYFFIDDSFIFGSVEVKDGFFGDFHEGEAKEELLQDAYTNLKGAYVIPGLVDIHIHGANGADTSDGTVEAIQRMSRYLASVGVTSFLPTAMTLPEEGIHAVTSSVLMAAASREKGAARPVGIRLEGPFLSKEKKGAQNEAYLRNPDREMFRRIWEKSEGKIKIIDVAPELPGAMDFIRSVSSDCRVSLGHTAADYDIAAEAFEAGASHLTHLYNAVNPLLHRAPGPIGAAFMNPAASAEIISDGIHSHPAALVAAFKLFQGRISLISDSIRCCGLTDGTYDLSGQEVHLTGRKVTLADGTIAGAALNLYEDMKNAVRFGIPKHEAILAATRVPADYIGETKIGRIEKGAYADFVVCDETLERRAVYISGNHHQSISG